MYHRLKNDFNSTITPFMPGSMIFAPEYTGITIPIQARVRRQAETKVMPKARSDGPLRLPELCSPRARTCIHMAIKFFSRLRSILLSAICFSMCLSIRSSIDAKQSWSTDRGRLHPTSAVDIRAVQPCGMYVVNQYKHIWCHCKYTDIHRFSTMNMS